MLFLINIIFLYVDNKESTKNNERTCTFCGKITSIEGDDACLGYLPG
ncbi:MAG: hypothetical protein ACLQG5_04435 [Methanobacterium sp.]|jgi:hypothetical protein